MKKLFIRVALVLALSFTVVQPLSMMQTTQVAVAKTKYYSRIKLSKIYAKLKSGQTVKKVKKILGKKLGKKTVIPTNLKKESFKYTVRFYHEKRTIRLWGNKTWGDVPLMGYSDITIEFYDGKLENWDRVIEEWYVDENGNKIDNPTEYYGLD